jgi:molybdenum cofactor cytidylyltransferase
VTPPVGLLLAAGASTRFGDRDKLMHRLADGTPLAVASARTLLSALPRVVAVVRPEALRVARLLRGAGARVLVCPDAARGMGHSLACGVRATADASGWLVALADMPFVRPATVARVVAALAQGAPIAAPACGGRRGHPVGFARAYGPQILALTGDRGARGLLEGAGESLCLLDCDDPGCLRDVDEPQGVRLDPRAGGG